MAGRRTVALAALVGAVFAVPAPASAEYSKTIAPGVSAGGVDLSNLTVEQAAERMSALLGPPLTATVQVTVGTGVFTLTAAEVAQRFDALRTAKRALYTGRKSPPPPPPSGGGSAPGLAIPLAVSHRRAAVRAFAARVASAANRRPRDARIRITVRHIFRQRSKPGRGVDTAALEKAVDAAFDNPAAPHALAPPIVALRARVTANDLARRYGTVLTIDRDHFKLRLFKRLKLARAYPIAVGMAGLDTPAGTYKIVNKQVNPTWSVPNSPWAGSLAGSVVPGGAPNNPLKARWLGIAAGVGIHGTAEDWSIGSRASHGCIRMHVADVIALYDRVPVGTPVLIR